MKGIAGEDKKDRPGIERAPRESDFWYPLGRRRQPELLRVHDGFAWRSTADLRPSKNSRWADVAVRQLSYVDCRARADRRSHWAEAVRVLRLRPLGVHSQRSPEPGLSMVRVSLQRFRSEGRTHGWPGCLGLGLGVARQEREILERAVRAVRSRRRPRARSSTKHSTWAWTAPIRLLFTRRCCGAHRYPGIVDLKDVEDLDFLVHGDLDIAPGQPTRPQGVLPLGDGGLERLCARWLAHVPGRSERKLSEEVVRPPAPEILGIPRAVGAHRQARSRGSPVAEAE